ncbi:MAG: transcriptional repressor LexA [Actinomycetaceae bacterium]|nr:transcriptional repressor LexA [Actinomycetaceae bacterium]
MASLDALRSHRPKTYAVYEAIASTLARTGYAPSLREIADLVGLASIATVKHHVDILQEGGFVRRADGKSRAIELLVHPEAAPRTALSVPTTFASDDDTVAVPLVGQIAAGAPILADQHVDDVVTLPRSLTGTGQLFMLEVHGESMIEAAICDGDFVVVRRQADATPGDIVAALLDDEATVKVFARRDGHVWLDPRNPAYEPILGDHATILGRVVTVMRSL